MRGAIVSLFKKISVILFATGVAESLLKKYTGVSVGILENIKDYQGLVTASIPIFMTILFSWL
jgi:hypothetical protein